MSTSTSGTMDTIDALTAEREAYVEHFRVHGEQQPAVASRLEARLVAAAKRMKGAERARALFELATVQRMTGRFTEAIKTYRRGVDAAGDAGSEAAAFEAWIGIARAHAYGTRDHGAAAAAFAQARSVAGDSPNRKQAYQLADYAAQLQAGRGELEAALINALEAIRLAETESDRFYALLDAADVLQKYAESCDYRKLQDALSYKEGDDPWGACRRAVTSARRYYERARSSAGKLGWTFLEQETEGFINRLALRAELIERRAAADALGQSAVFSARSADDVLVNESFAAGGSELGEFAAFGGVIEQVLGAGDRDDPRSLYLLGIKVDLEGEQGRALAHFQQAVEALERERASALDLRRRGTVVENRPELVRDLGLRLLSLGEREAAFAAFESIRARGLTELAAAFAAHDFGPAERQWLAALIHAQSRESALLNRIVELEIASVEADGVDEALRQLELARARQRALTAQTDFAETAERFTRASGGVATLAQLERAVARTGIPVVLYWTTPTNVLVWAVTPEQTLVRTVFLPESAVLDKVRRVVESIGSTTRPFDRAAARELHAYLVAPFRQHLDYPQMLVVPQGALVTLPFEALVNGQTDRFLVQERAVSYAPSATLALRALTREPGPPRRLTALLDEEVELSTGEVARIGRNSRLAVSTVKSAGLDPRQTLEALGQSESVHVLLHGTFDPWDPLSSYLTLNNPELSRTERRLTAAQLLAADWSDVRLAVFSACEGARVNVRISNEVFGLSWAPMVGGTDQVVMSRWRVNGDSNAEWMEHFYDHLTGDGSSPALAAAAAMRHMIGGERADPYYWSAPQVFGR